MKNIKKIIKEALNEIFDNPEVPKDINLISGENYVVYTFKTEKSEYSVSFKKVNNFLPIGLTKDEKINNIITNSNSVYYLSWGLFDSSNAQNPIDDVETAAGEEIYVFNAIFGIILEFIKQNNPDIVFYKAIQARKRIYDKMFGKINLNYILSQGTMNTFLIKKDLL